jgi:diacylglycerol kinase (ATP)
VPEQVSRAKMKNFLTSLRCAYNGIRYAFATEKNIRIHLLVFVLVIIAAILLHLSKIEILLILGFSALIFSLEFTNTAIERLADKVSPGYDAQIGAVKDVMAAAVLVASIFAVITGLVIFFEALLKLFQGSTAG